MPAGTFWQGVPSSEPGSHHYEYPQFYHTLTKNLAVMETEVTRQMWVDLTKVQPTLPGDPSAPHYSSGMSDPVQGIDQYSWSKAALFANLLSRQQGLQQVYYADPSLTIPITVLNFQTSYAYVAANWNANGYRLPTEGEWEYFARADTTGPFFMNEPAYNELVLYSCNAGVLKALESVAWMCANAGDKTHPAGSKAANPWGLKDVLGNVAEICWDMGDAYPTNGPQTDYRGVADILRIAYTGHIIRGGSYHSSPRFARTGFRYFGNIDFSSPEIGFRLVRSLN